MEGSISPLYSIFQEVKKIRKDINSVIAPTIGGKRIKIDTYSSEDRHEELEHLKNRVAKNKQSDKE